MSKESNNTKANSTKEVMKFDTEVEKIFQLMIHSVYENKEIFLRELIANASDACDKLRYKALTQPDILGGEANFKITITADKEAGTLTIADNGIGMSRSEMIKNLGTVACSGTQKFAAALTGDNKTDSNLIGQFGIGFYSCFMVSDKVSVISQSAGGKAVNIWESDGSGKFSIDKYKGKNFTRGTQITIQLKEEEKEYLDEYRIKHIVDTYSNHTIFDIELQDGQKSELLNKGNALWTRSKSEVSEEEHNEFYKSVAYMGDDTPWLTLHNKAEGAVEYTNLLYIPSKKPFDLFHPDRSTRVKLYVKRVFIADEGVDIVPSYLRFLRGVVDSEDLPLNISRETVQNSVVLAKIKSSITKKILSELKKKSAKEPEEYAKFWDNFGPVLKEGLCEAMEPRDPILEVCRFRTSKSGEKTISMQEYLDNKDDSQESIYYLLADDYESALNSPHIESLVKQGIEVIFLTDSVDDFWVNVLSEYKNTPLQSVTRSNADKSDDDKKAQEETASQNSEVIKFFKDTLGDNVGDVIATDRLASSPVCLTAPEGSMDIRMERFMVENKQMAAVSKKNLEININHPIVKAIADGVKGGDDDKKLADNVHLLFAQANIIEGEPVGDIKEFTRRINDLLEGTLVA